MIVLEYLYPELILIIGFLTCILIGVFQKNSFDLISKIIILIFFSCLLVFYINPKQEIVVLNNTYSIDHFSVFLKSLILISSIFVLIFTKEYIQRCQINFFEYPILLLSSVIGMFVMISSNDLIGLYLGIELQSLSLYVLASSDKNSIKSTEAGVKYFILGALSSGLFLYGCSLIYGFSGHTNYFLINENINNGNLGVLFGFVFILIGLAFKISSAPFHMWAPDVYEGSPTSVTAFFSLAPKVAGLGALIKILFIAFGNIINEWKLILTIISILSMFIGALAAIGQTNIKRLMAYSSIGHIGYALIGLVTGVSSGLSATLIYISIYVVMNIAVFSCVFFFKRGNVYFENISDLSGLSKNHPILALCFTLILFSLAGIPPLAGFFAKFYIFKSAIETNLYLLAILGLVSSVIAAFYYLRIIKIMYFDNEVDKFDDSYNLGLKISLLLSTFIISFYFIKPDFIINFSNLVVKIFN
jgi:NADH-quinone oxidoreductase subunit N